MNESEFQRIKERISAKAKLHKSLPTSVVKGGSLKEAIVSLSTQNSKSGLRLSKERIDGVSEAVRKYKETQKFNEMHASSISGRKDKEDRNSDNSTGPYLDCKSIPCPLFWAKGQSIEYTKSQEEQIAWAKKSVWDEDKESKKVSSIIASMNAEDALKILHIASASNPSVSFKVASLIWDRKELALFTGISKRLRELAVDPELIENVAQSCKAMELAYKANFMKMRHEVKNNVLSDAKSLIERLEGQENEYMPGEMQAIKVSAHIRPEGKEGPVAPSVRVKVK